MIQWLCMYRLDSIACLILKMYIYNSESEFLFTFPIGSYANTLSFGFLFDTTTTSSQEKTLCGNHNGSHNTQLRT